jgi:hypothetical protein
MQTQLQTRKIGGGQNRSASKSEVTALWLASEARASLSSTTTTILLTRLVKKRSRISDGRLWVVSFALDFYFVSLSTCERAAKMERHLPLFWVAFPHQVKKLAALTAYDIHVT